MPSAEVAPAHRWVRLVVLAAALGAGAAGQYWLSVVRTPHWSAAAWTLAAALFIAAYLLGRDGRALPAATEDRLPPRAEWFWCLLVLAVGTFFTVFRLAEFPPGLNHDAAWEGLYALDILRGIPYAPYVSAAWGRETLTFYFRAASIWLLGPTVLAIILPSVIAGVLVLPFFYWWARNMFGARFALMATLLLGVSGWHLVFSRTGWRSDFQPLFMVITCCFFVRGMLTASPLDFGLSGIGLSLALNTYNGARPFPLMFPLWLLLVLLQSWTWRGFLRRYGLGLLAMVVTFGITIAPLTWYAINNWEKFNARAVALQDMTGALGAVGQTLLLFNDRGNGDDFFITTPGLEYPAALFLVFGVLWGLTRVRDERAQFLLLGLVVNALGGIISKPNMNRNIGMMPFVYFFAALGVTYFALQLRRLVPRAGHVVAGVFLVIVGAAAARATFMEYLSENRRDIWGFYPETTVLGQYMRTLAPDYQIYVGDTPFFPRDTMTYLMYRGGDPMARHYTWLDDVSQLLRMPLRPPPGKGMAFLIENAGRGPAVLAELQRRFPTHLAVELRYPPGGARVFVKGILVAPDAAAAPVAAPSAPGVGAVAALGAPAGRLHEPRGLALAPDGTVFVADFGNERIQAFGPDMKAMRAWGVHGNAAGEFAQPGAVAVGPTGDIYVADTWNHRVQVFSSDGAFLRAWGAGLYGPRGIAVDGSGSVYVVDTGNNRVMRFSAEGQLEKAWGSKGAGPGQFVEPVGIFVDEAGTVYVVDNGNGRLEWISRDGQFVGQLEVDGWSSKAYSEPHVALDDKGVIWVTVPGAREVRAYDRRGKLLRTITGTSIPGATFETPMGIAFDAKRRELVIADLADKLVRVPIGK